MTDYIRNVVIADLLNNSKDNDVNHFSLKLDMDPYFTVDEIANVVDACLGGDVGNDEVGIDNSDDDENVDDNENNSNECQQPCEQRTERIE